MKLVKAFMQHIVDLGDILLDCEHHAVSLINFANLIQHYFSPVYYGFWITLFKKSFNSEQVETVTKLVNIIKANQ